LKQTDTAILEENSCDNARDSITNAKPRTSSANFPSVGVAGSATHEGSVDFGSKVDERAAQSPQLLRLHAKDPDSGRSRTIDKMEKVAKSHLRQQI